MLRPGRVVQLERKRPPFFAERRLAVYGQGSKSFSRNGTEEAEKKREKRGEGLRVQFLSGGGSQREKNGEKKEKKEETRDEERESRCVRDTRVAATTQKRFLPLAGEIERCLLSFSLSLAVLLCLGGSKSHGVPGVP